MKVLFVCSAMEQIGIGYLSAALKARGHETNLVFSPSLFDDGYSYSPRLARLVSFDREVVEQALAARADLIAFSVVGQTFDWAAGIAREIRARSPTPIVFGGMHVTRVGREVLDHPCIDYYIRGEGEDALADLADALENGGNGRLAEVRNLGFREEGGVRENALRPLVQDLDSIPFPDKDLFRRLGPPFTYGYFLLTERNCPHLCPFCYNGILRGAYAGDPAFHRRRSVESSLEELREAKRRGEIQVVRMAAANFISSPQWASELCRGYRKEIGAPFWCYVQARQVSEGTARDLEAAGCFLVEFGAHSVSASAPETIFGVERVRAELERAVAIFKKTRIFTVVDFILGLPGQTEREVAEMARFYARARFDRLQVLWLHTVPGLPITERAEAQGLICPDRAAGVRGVSFFFPHRIFNRTFGQYRTVMLAARYLPAGVVDFILDRPRLVRSLPYLPILATQVITYFSRREKRFELVRTRLKISYRRFLAMRLRLWLFPGERARAGNFLLSSAGREPSRRARP